MADKLSERMKGFMKRWSDPGRPVLLPKEPMPELLTKEPPKFSFMTCPWTEYYLFISVWYQGFMNLTVEQVTEKIGAPNGYSDGEILCEWYIRCSTGDTMIFRYMRGDPLMHIYGKDFVAITNARKILW